MGTPSSRRSRLPVLATAALLLVAGLPATPAAAAPAQEPGVTLRVFDVQVPLNEICTLKPGQTPNVDKLMSTINWTSTGDFGFDNNFVAQALGNLNVTTAGSHTFRLISDDGSVLRIDDDVVIDHDGLHGPTPKDGTVTLSTGLHPLRIDHFERDGGQQLTLQWKPPGASGFTVVPNSALSTDAGVVRVTAPGRKDCEGVTDSPGDGLQLNGVHPSYTLTNLRPNGFQPKVTGMDWLADGRMVISTWGGSDQSGTSQSGEVFILDNTDGSTGPGSVTTKKIAGGLKEPMGLKVVDGVVYVSEKQRLTRLVDTNGDEVTDQYQQVATWPYGGNFHEFAFGLLYDAGYFYLNLSVSINYGGATTDPQPAANRGTTIKVNKDTGAVEYIAGGLRTPHGIGWGPNKSIFVTDNQGGWLPSSKLVHVKPGRFFNHYMNPDGPFDGNPVTPPVLWMPQNEIANSPSTPMLLPSGTFAGQFVIGDVTYGGLQRAFLEQVNGEYQGALFRMTQGLEAGVSEVNVGPDGAIYVGGLGAGGNWGQSGKLSYGLQKLTPNGSSTFDILAMRATTTGFEMEYTQPLSADTAANLVSRYKVKQWRYQPTASYGGPKIDEENLTVTSATLSADGKKVSLTVSGRKAGHVVYVRSPRPFSSTTGQSLWSTEAWYTLNAIPGGGSSNGAGPITGVGGKCLDVSNSGTANGTKIQLWTCNGTAAQQWSRVGNTFQALGKCLDVSNAGTANGTKVQLWTCNGSAAQVWQPQSNGSILNPNSGKVLDAQNGSSANGTQIHIWEYVGADNQHWTINGANRIQLFDGANLDKWQKTDGSAVTWPISGGSAEVLGGDIRTDQSFNDFKLHVEFWLPNLPSNVTGQTRANSGVYLQNRYEIQVLDTYGKPTLANNECASIYLKRAPDSNAATAPETWQTYEITFRAARFNGSTKTENARVTVVWNGVTVHDDVAIDGPTGAGAPEGPTAGPIRLQDHNDPGANVRYRNIWIEPMN